MRAMLGPPNMGDAGGAVLILVLLLVVFGVL